MSEVDGVKAINKVTFGQRLKAYKRSKLSFLLAVLVLLSAIITIGVLGYLIFYILIKGVPASFPVAAKDMANLRGREIGDPYKPNLPTPEGPVLDKIRKEMKPAGLI